jgi:hypothetical protein
MRPKIKQRVAELRPRYEEEATSAPAGLSATGADPFLPGVDVPPWVGSPRSEPKSTVLH